MTRLPVIVGFGGVNAAGRSSFHAGYRRLVLDSLPPQEQIDTCVELASMMKLVSYDAGQWRDQQGQVLTTAEIADNYGDLIRQSTLIRRIEESCFDVEATPWQKKVTMAPATDSSPITFQAKRQHLPEPLPEGWQVSDVDERTVQVSLTTAVDVRVTTQRRFPVQSAGQLPSGFEPGNLYPSRNHPRGLQMAVYGASDAIHSMGVSWEQVVQRVAPDQIAVYAGSSMSQLDYNGSGGMLQARMLGKKVTSKQCALGFCGMPADFVNAYVLGSVGATGNVAGACASFLYNLRVGMNDIKSGRRRVVLVGTSEAPVTSEVADGYAAMGALATANEILQLDRDAGASEPDLRRASRPFGENCGFTLAESSQFVVLFDDELALELGANIHGSVTDVFVNADGHKKSISSPGAGNYVTVAKAVATARSLLGEKAIQQRSFIQAHGSSTPQNRVTESHILNEVAKAFNIERWPVGAVKSMLGHSIGSAGGDQMMATLGAWHYGLLPGIKTIDALASDVYASNLAFAIQDMNIPRDSEVAFLNAKGFGGNNATATVLSPQATKQLLTRRHGLEAMAAHEDRHFEVSHRCEENSRALTQGQLQPIYKFNHNVVDTDQIELTDQQLSIPGYADIDLNLTSEYSDSASH